MPPIHHATPIDIQKFFRVAEMAYGESAVSNIKKYLEDRGVSEAGSDAVFISVSEDRAKMPFTMTWTGEKSRVAHTIEFNEIGVMRDDKGNVRPTSTAESFVIGFLLYIGWENASSGGPLMAFDSDMSGRGLDIASMVEKDDQTIFYGAFWAYKCLSANGTKDDVCKPLLNALEKTATSTRELQSEIYNYSSSLRQQ